MGHDHLCLMSGFAPDNGPHRLVPPSDWESVAHEVVNEIRTTFENTPVDLLSIVLDSLKFVDGSDFCGDSGWKLKKLPEWRHFDICVAIGYFENDTEHIYQNENGDARSTSGRNIQVRRVRDNWGYSGLFADSLMGLKGLESERKISNCTPCPENPNFFVLEVCYRYLESWLNWTTLPPRAAFPNDPEPMSIAGELYEIINSREEPRNCDDPMGILPCIDYDGMEKSTSQYLANFVEIRSGSDWAGDLVRFARERLGAVSSTRFRGLDVDTTRSMA